MSLLIEALLLFVALILYPFCIGHFLFPSEKLGVGLRTAIGLILIALVWITFHRLGLPKILAHSTEALLVAIGAFRARPTLKSLFGKNRMTVLTLLVISFWGAIHILAQPVIGADAVAIWLVRVKAISQWISLQSLSGLHFPLLGYPYLGAALWEWPLEFTGIHNESLGRLTYLVLFVCMASETISIVVGETKHNGLLCFCSVGLWAFFDPNIFLSGYQDALLVILSTIGALQFLQIFHDPEKPKFVRCTVLAALFLGAMAWIKAEGLVLGAILVFSFAVSLYCFDRSLMQKRRYDLMLFLSLFLGLSMGWTLLQVFCGQNVAQIQEGNFVFSDIFHLSDRIVRLPYIFKQLAGIFGRLDSFAGPLLISFVLASLLPKRCRVEALFVALCCLLHIAFIAFTFLMTRENFEWHVTTALARLCCQTSGLRLLMTLLASRGAIEIRSPSAYQKSLKTLL